MHRKSNSYNELGWNEMGGIGPRGSTVVLLCPLVASRMRRKSLVRCKIRQAGGFGFF